MKKTLFLLATSSVLFLTPAANAASGIFGTGTVITANGGLTLYESTLLGDGRHAPLGASPTLNTVGLGGLDLGTYDPDGGNTLVLNGGGVLTFKNGTDNITGTRIYYSINGGTESSFGLIFNEDNVNGNGGDQRWYADGNSVDLLSGLSNGTHTLTIRYEADFTFDGGGGVHQSGAPGSVGNNSTSPYVANFTIIPEPSTVLLSLLGAGALLLRRRR